MLISCFSSWKCNENSFIVMFKNIFRCSLRLSTSKKKLYQITHPLPTFLCIKRCDIIFRCPLSTRNHSAGAYLLNFMSSDDWIFQKHCTLMNNCSQFFSIMMIIIFLSVVFIFVHSHHHVYVSSRSFSLSYSFSHMTLDNSLLAVCVLFIKWDLKKNERELFAL